MKQETKARIRVVGRILFLVYLLALVYFLFLQKNTGEETFELDYRYNLVPFQEIRRFWIYREKVGFLAAFLNLAGNVIGFLPFGFIVPVMHKNGEFLESIASWFYVQPLRGDDSAHHEGGLL